MLDRVAISNRRRRTPHRIRRAACVALSWIGRCGRRAIACPGGHGIPEPAGSIALVAASPTHGAMSCLAARTCRRATTCPVVLDDALQGVSHVVRGADLAASTDVHALLQRLLGLPSPLYHHHRLLLDEDGDKLAKSANAKPLREWRASGKTPGWVRRQAGLAMSRSEPVRASNGPDDANERAAPRARTSS